VKFAAVVPTVAAVLLTVGMVGCKHNSPPASEPAATTPDLTPMPTPAPTPTAAPVEVQPTAPEAAPMKESNASKGSITGHKYTVQTGDTLYSIAKRKYGHGSSANIRKIQKANPSLKGDALKVGQVLKLP
jgi:nucleoid-associated protein YgaU